MGDEPATSASLLIRLRDRGDHAAWSRFVDVYQPLVHGFARKHSLQEADAADLTQEVLRAVARSVGRLDYDPRRGSFRGWLFTVVRNQLRDFRERKRRQVQGSGNSGVQQLLNEQAAPPERPEEEWDRDYQRRLFTWAADQVRPAVQAATWQAFWQTAVEGKSGQEVAQALGLSVAAVYLAKSRVMARLKQEIRQLQAE
jgi:RNA polymerase sigma-70 factor (ECF subfamily)